MSFGVTSIRRWLSDWKPGATLYAGIGATLLAGFLNAQTIQTANLHTIKHGDNLTKIVKQYYPELRTDREVANRVLEIQADPENAEAFNLGDNSGRDCIGFTGKTVEGNFVRDPVQPVTGCFPDGQYDKLVPGTVLHFPDAVETTVQTPVVVAEPGAPTSVVATPSAPAAVVTPAPVIPQFVEPDVNAPPFSKSKLVNPEATLEETVAATPITSMPPSSSSYIGYAPFEPTPSSLLQERREPAFPESPTANPLDDRGTETWFRNRYVVESTLADRFKGCLPYLGAAALAVGLLAYGIVRQRREQHAAPVDLDVLLADDVPSVEVEAALKAEEHPVTVKLLEVAEGYLPPRAVRNLYSLFHPLGVCGLRREERLDPGLDFSNSTDAPTNVPFEPVKDPGYVPPALQERFDEGAGFGTTPPSVSGTVTPAPVAPLQPFTTETAEEAIPIPPFPPLLPDDERERLPGREQPVLEPSIEAPAPKPAEPIPFSEPAPSHEQLIKALQDKSLPAYYRRVYVQENLQNLPESVTQALKIQREEGEGPGGFGVDRAKYVTQAPNGRVTAELPEPVPSVVAPTTATSLPPDAPLDLTAVGAEVRRVRNLKRLNLIAEVTGVPPPTLSSDEPSVYERALGLEPPVEVPPLPSLEEPRATEPVNTSRLNFGGPPMDDTIDSAVEARLNPVESPPVDTSKVIMSVRAKKDKDPDKNGGSGTPPTDNGPFNLTPPPTGGSAAAPLSNLVAFTEPSPLSSKNLASIIAETYRTDRAAARSIYQKLAPDEQLDTVKELYRAPVVAIKQRGLAGARHSANYVSIDNLVDLTGAVNKYEQLRTLDAAGVLSHGRAAAQKEYVAARRDDAELLYDNGIAVKDIAQQLGVSASTVYRDLKVRRDVKGAATSEYKASDAKRVSPAARAYAGRTTPAATAQPAAPTMN